MSVLYGKGYGEDLRLCMSRLDCDYKMRSGICSLAWSYYPVRNPHRLENHVDYLLNSPESISSPNLLDKEREVSLNPLSPKIDLDLPLKDKLKRLKPKGRKEK
jgi:hypothetical protein